MPIGYGGVVGAPDAMTGHGYSSIRGGAGNQTRPMWRGFPYHDLDLAPEEYDEEDEDDLDDEAVKVSQQTDRSYVAGDHMGMHARDRRSYMDSSTYGLANVPPFAEARSILRRRIREISSSIRLRPRSSEPDSGTIYGWSSPPMWNEPPRKAGVRRPRLNDIIFSDEEDDFEEDQERLRLDAVEETLLRDYIRCVLREARL